MQGVVEDWLGDTVVPWPEADGPWDLALHWGAGDSGAVCTGLDLRLRADRPVQALTASQLRGLRLHELVRDARRRKYAEVGGGLIEAYDAAVAAGEAGSFGVTSEFVAALRREAGDWADPDGSVRLTLDHYRRVAIVYSTALDAGENPLRAVIEHPDWGPTSKPTASRWVARARQEGFLPPTERGRARGNAALVHSGEVSR